LPGHIALEHHPKPALVLAERDSKSVANLYQRPLLPILSCVYQGVVLIPADDDDKMVVEVVAKFICSICICPHIELMHVGSVLGILYLADEARGKRIVKNQVA
jgi:hypothetical protein